jgi:hypothetical protein
MENKMLLKEYAVVFTYNFDPESEIFLFDDYDTAKNFLKESFEREVNVEEVENGWEIDSWHNDEWTWATITHWVNDGHDDCEYRLCTHVERKSNEI